MFIIPQNCGIGNAFHKKKAKHLRRPNSPHQTRFCMSKRLSTAANPQCSGALQYRSRLQRLSCADGLCLKGLIQHREPAFTALEQSQPQLRTFCIVQFAYWQLFRFCTATSLSCSINERILFRYFDKSAVFKPSRIMGIYCSLDYPIFSNARIHWREVTGFSSVI